MEGCLSFPGFSAAVVRPTWIEASAAFRAPRTGAHPQHRLRTRMCISSNSVHAIVQSLLVGQIGGLPNPRVCVRFRREHSGSRKHVFSIVASSSCLKERGIPGQGKATYKGSCLQVMMGHKKGPLKTLSALLQIRSTFNRCKWCSLHSCSFQSFSSNY